MKLERVVTEMPPGPQLRAVDMTRFAHTVYEDVRSGHLYIVTTVKVGNGLQEKVMRLTND